MDPTERPVPPSAAGVEVAARSASCTQAAGEPSLSRQLVWLFVLAAPVASVSWTVTKEEIFREPREYLARQARDEGNSVLVRKLCYLPTCYYCFSHYVTLFFLAVTRYRLLLPGWRGYLISFFAVTWVADFYMVLFRHLAQA
jgi:hypothetical protein